MPGLGLEGQVGVSWGDRAWEEGVALGEALLTPLLGSMSRAEHLTIGFTLFVFLKSL